MKTFKRRERITFTKRQLDILNEAFDQNNYPETNQRDQLANVTGLKSQRIQVWFQNRRSKERKLKTGSRQSSGDGSAASPGSHDGSRSDHLTTPVTPLTADDNSHLKHSSRRSSHNQPHNVFVFDTQTANEAALAVGQRKYGSILDFHRHKYNHSYESYTDTMGYSMRANYDPFRSLVFSSPETSSNDYQNGHQSRNSSTYERIQAKHSHALTGSRQPAVSLAPSSSPSRNRQLAHQLADLDHSSQDYRYTNRGTGSWIPTNIV